MLVYVCVCMCVDMCEEMENVTEIKCTMIILLASILNASSKYI